MSKKQYHPFDHPGKIARRQVARCATLDRLLRIRLGENLLDQRKLSPQKRTLDGNLGVSAEGHEETVAALKWLPRRDRVGMPPHV